MEAQAGVDLEGMVAAVVVACQQLQVPGQREQAEATLMHFRRAPGCLAACRHLLATSADAVVCFHAAAAMQDCVVRDAVSIQLSDHLALQRFLLDYALVHGAHGHTPLFVRSKVLAVLATLIKRTWMDMAAEQREQLLAHVFELITGNTSPTAKTCAMALLEALLSEFSVSTASSIGLPADYHTRCHTAFQHHVLKRVFAAAFEGARMALFSAGAALASGGGEVAAGVPGALSQEQRQHVAGMHTFVTACVRVMSSVLFWDFSHASAASGAQRFQRRGRGTGAGTSGAAPSDDRSAATADTALAIAPGVEWRDVLLSDALTAFLRELYASLPRLSAACGGGNGDEWRSDELAVNCRQLTVQMCCITGPVLRATPSVGSGQGHAAQPLQHAQANGGAANGDTSAAAAAAAAAATVEEERALVLLHMSHVLPLVCQWVWPPHHVVAAVAAHQRCDSELVQGCRAIAALVRLHTNALIAHIPGCSDGGGTSVSVSVLELLVQLTCAAAHAYGLSRRGPDGSGGVQNGGSGHDDEDDADGESGVQQALWLLLDAWQPLLLQVLGEPAGGVGSAPTAAQQEQQQLAAQVSKAAEAAFAKLMEAELRMAAACAHDEEDAAEHMAVEVEGREERLAMTAALGRACAGQSLSAVMNVLAHTKGLLLQAAAAGAQGEMAAVEAMEQLYWLTGMAAHLLADPAEGETPVLPWPIRALLCTPGASATDLQPLEGISLLVLEMASWVHNSNAAQRDCLLSPRLFSSLLSFFARWCPTYLSLDASSITSSSSSTSTGSSSTSSISNSSSSSGSSNSSINAAGGAAMREFAAKLSVSGGGASVLNAVLSASFAALTLWPSEPDIQHALCSELLPALTRQAALAGPLRRTEGWQQVEAAFQQRHPALAALPGPLQRTLSSALIQAASSFSKDPAECQRVVKSLLDPLVTSLSAIACAPDLATLCHKPAVVLQVESLLECLRGAARSTTPATHSVSFAAGVALGDPILTLMTAYRHEARVVYLILKYVTVWVDAQVLFLSPSDTRVLFVLCQRLLHSYAQHHLATVSVSVSLLSSSTPATGVFGHGKAGGKTQRSSSNSIAGALPATAASAAPVSAYKGVKALLQLLCSLTSKDFVDFGSDSPSDSADVSEMVFFGFNVVVPLVSTELLRFPKLCHQFFTLVEHMLSAHPDRVPQLPPAPLSALLTSLAFGLAIEDEDVQVLALSALSSLASFHVKAHAAGHPGLSLVAMPPAAEAAVAAATAAAATTSTTPVLLGSDVAQAVLFPRLPQHQAQQQQQQQQQQAAEQQALPDEPLLLGLLRLLLRLILSHYSSPAAVEAGADALLPLVATQTNEVEALLQVLVQPQHPEQAATQQRQQQQQQLLLTAVLGLRVALGEAMPFVLTTAARGGGVPRHVKQRFRGAVVEFWSKARTVVSSR